jgi:2-polyprenyl-6-methoxyphenol hydroxylase-like FAD-dependent oxidoreductase
MSDILVLGSGLTGLTAAMLLARDGHAVTVLDRDPAPPPENAEAAWTQWARPGVAQFRQLHFLLPRWRAIMADELPEVLTAMLAAGAARTNVLHQRPADVTGGWRPGDERFDAVTARRPVIEAAVAGVAARTPGVTIRRGTRVSGLVTAGRSAVPRVVGVRTDGRRRGAAGDTGRGLRRPGAPRAGAAVGGPPVAVARPRPGRAAGGGRGHVSPVSASRP